MPTTSWPAVHRAARSQSSSPGVVTCAATPVVQTSSTDAVVVTSITCASSLCASTCATNATNQPPSIALNALMWPNAKLHCSFTRRASTLFWTSFTAVPSAASATSIASTCSAMKNSAERACSSSVNSALIRATTPATWRITLEICILMRTSCSTISVWSARSCTNTREVFISTRAYVDRRPSSPVLIVTTKLTTRPDCWRISRGNIWRRCFRIWTADSSLERRGLRRNKIRSDCWVDFEERQSLMKIIVFLLMFVYLFKIGLQFWNIKYIFINVDACLSTIGIDYNIIMLMYVIKM